ncbi:MAG: RNA-binding S4 domain-containing protein [Saprospiraceae bacterium]
MKGREYIELNKFLKLKHLVQNGGETNISIENSEVIVNGVVEFRKRNKLRDGYIVEFRDQQILIKA